MSLRKSYKTDADAETNGVWADVGYSDQFKGPISFKLARMAPSNKVYATALERAYRPHEAAQRAGTLSTELGNTIFRRVFCETIVKDWRNVSKEELTGNPEDAETQAVFSTEDAIKLLTDLPDLESLLIEKAKSLAAYAEATQETDAKN